LAGLGAALILLWFWRLERQGREITVLATIIGLLVVEGSVYPGFDAPVGVFHPTFGSLSFRPYEILIVIAVAARLLARGTPARMGPALLWWLGFLSWIGVAAFVGLTMGHSGKIVAFEAKAVIYLGAMVLAAGIPAQELIGGRTIRRLLLFSAGVATLMICLDSAGIRVTGRVLGVPLEESGRMGADAASIFLALGTLALARGVTSNERRLPMLVAACPLVLSTFVPSQRATLLSFVAMAALLVLAGVMTSPRARLRASSGEIAATALMLVALVTLPWVVGGIQGKQLPSYPLASRVSVALTDRSKQLSAEDRVNQYNKAIPLILEKPFLGWGLGKTYSHFHPGPDVFEENNLTHNIAGDLLLRTGVVGLVLFGTAMWLALRDGWRVWRDHSDGAVACMALACVAVLTGLMAKGMAESVFEKFRLAVLIGVFLGILRSLVTSSGPPEAPDAVAAETGRAPAATISRAPV